MAKGTVSTRRSSKVLHSKVVHEEVLQLKVIQSDWQARVRGYAYRVIEIFGKQTLDELASAILESFDFIDDHAYGFYDNLKNWTAATEKYEWFVDDEDLKAASWFHSDARSVKCTAVASVFTIDKKKMLFLFDYGEEWHFIVQLLRTTHAEADALYPRVISSQGDSQEQYPMYEDDAEEEAVAENNEGSM